MDICEDIAALEHYLDELAAGPDDALQDRYAMHRPARPKGLYWQLRWLAGQVLRRLQSVGLLSANPWPVRLAHSGTSRNDRPVLIWAIGIDRDRLREATVRLSRLLDEFPGLAPVLVTDTADFAFFSRLGWLVEYVPDIDGEGEYFRSRKLQYLARLYRGAPALPVHSGLAEIADQEAISRWLLSRT